MSGKDSRLSWYDSTMIRSFALLFAATLVISSGSQITHAQQPPALTAEVDESGQQIVIHRAGVDAPIVTQHARPDFRPYLHPLVAPDGNGILTEVSPDHHKHQTGVCWGFTRLNGRDYFHHPEGSYWKRVSLNILKAEAGSRDDSVQWQTVYDLLSESGEAVLRESMIWTMTDRGGQYVLELQWSGEAQVDVTISKYDYGGLFVRMPWQPGMDGSIVNSARQEGMRAEGQRAVWADVGLQVTGRDNRAHIAIFDHPQNAGFPQPWRVDSQLGLGPVRARLGDWKIAKGETATVKHQLVVFTGELDDVALTDQWAAWSGQKMAYAQWRQAQEEGRRAEFLTPEKAVKSMTLQDGFQASVWAAEPMLTQPMAFCWDSKGRLWIAENRDYETRQTGFANDGNSRILILEDTNRDGVADSRKVFAEGIPFPAGIAVGMGGLWLGAPPNLLFVPDADGDDKADMDNIEVRLTGWGIRDRHETLNSFRWGPDGWLYGCQGYATPSRVGKPAGKGKLYRHKDPFPEDIAFDGDTVDINGGVWRYHPTKDRFEVVAHGFSNPWGLDFDANGQLFITACVIPHLWHVVPGGIYHRQGGSHFNPHVYSDIRTIADHRHRSAHGGARVYQSDAFPQKYKGRIFMANIHEHAVLTDILEPSGSGFVGRHGDDFALANNAQWIGFSVEVGPDGNLYVLDWHDADICGKEVLNKETGRIFRFAPQKSAAQNFPNRYADIATLSDMELVQLQQVDSAWHTGRARVELQYRATQRAVDPAAVQTLRAWLADSTVDADLRLRSLWTLHITHHLSTEQLMNLLEQDHQDEHLRAWCVQLLCEDCPVSAVVASAIDRLASNKRSQSSAIVRLYLAAAMQRIEANSAFGLAEKLCQSDVDIDDHNIPRMIWFGLEPLVLQFPDRALKLAMDSKIPLISRHIARRMTDTDHFESLLNFIAKTSSNQLPMLLGVRDALEGRFDLKSPANWPPVYAELRSAGAETAKLALQLSQQFGDTAAAQAMLTTLMDATAAPADRRQALQGLAGRSRPELKSQLVKLLDDDQLRPDAIRAVAAFDDRSLAQELLRRYGGYSSADRLEVIHALATRPAYAMVLTDALRENAVPKPDVPAYVARLLRRMVGNSFVDVWGPIEGVTADSEAAFAKYRTLLTADALGRANPSRGRSVFNRTCAVCHKLHGHGGMIGPDITGANRTNLEYLLGNILTPSAIIQDAYKMHIVLTEDGRVYSGIPAEENDRVVKLRVANREQPVAIAKSQIESREIAPVSMMPEGMLKTLQDAEVVDLIAYLQSLKQVPLP